MNKSWLLPVIGVFALAIIVFFGSSKISQPVNYGPTTSFASIEKGVASFSPSGVSGGVAIPASCESSYEHNPGECTSCGGWSGCSASCGGGTQTQTCTRVDGSTYNNTQSCNTQPCPPTASLSANPPTINRGQSSTLSWTSSYADWCDITNDVGPDIGRVNPNGSTVVTLTETTNYTITCVGSGGMAIANATVTVRPLPTVDLQGPSIVELPDPVNLTWFTQNADSCTASLDWSGNKSTPNGSESFGLGRGNYTFKLSCTGPGCPGTGLCPVIDTQNTRVVDVPRCDFSADPNSIIPPQKSRLSWQCPGSGIGGGIGRATSCEIDQGIGNVDTSGTLEVRPAAATTYTLECVGRDGSKSFNTSVGVGFIPQLKEVIPRP